VNALEAVQSLSVSDLGDALRFFYTKLSEKGYTYKNVERWAKRAKVSDS